MRHLITTSLVLVACHATVVALAVPVIDFETVPGTTPFEGLIISNQYEASTGVTFELEGGGFPVLAEVGNPRTAFAPNDTPLPGQGIGQFFLTDDGLTTGLTSPALIIRYNTPTAQASGVILDIDFNDAFVIEARDINETVLETINIQAGDPGTGNAVATFWGFARPQADVTSIRLKGTTSAGGFFGLGFDRFNTRAIPEPTSLALLGLSLVALLGRRSVR